MIVAGFEIQRDIAAAVIFAFPKRFGITPETMAAKSIYGAQLVYLFELFIDEGIQRYESLEWIGLAFEGSRFRLPAAQLENLVIEAERLGILEREGEGWKLGGVLKAGK